MQEHHYTWALALSMIGFSHARNADTATDDQGVPMVKVTARAGHLQASTETAANDALVADAALLLGFIYVLECAKYRSTLLRKQQNGLLSVQNHETTILALDFSIALAIQWLHEIGRLFLESERMCQINTPLTGA
ncbi:hypothetical protein [Propionivibrio sp.]|uniref:hypothetical protein n=1 Tax=Propionivibrio sp. TaxID=2212460 RepID=UPI003BF18125